VASNRSFGLAGIVVLLLFCLLPQFSFSQSDRLEDLNKKKRAMEKEIQFLTQARDSARSKKEATFADLELLNRQVYLRQQLIRTIGRQITALDEEIARTAAVIVSLEEDVEKIKTDFGKLMIVTYKSLHNKSSAFYVISSKSVSQGYKRTQYFRAISRMQQSQMNLIRRTKAFLADKRVEMEEQKDQKKEAAVQQKQEEAKMLVLKEEQKALYTQLKADEAKFDQNLQDTRKALTNLNKEIGNEIARLAEIRRKKNLKAPKAERDVILKLTSNFDKNKGKFPWPMPMPNGTITRHFGRQTLPGSDIVVDLQGIDIATLPNQKVRSIFAGKVETIMPVMGQGKMVIISHGNYYTVYANLQTVDLKAGQEIEMLQSIGTARTDASSGETKIHFQVYKDRVPQNPESWLVKK
jgi:septal ring factor EnvC (AmiA/AmiB activator)